ncbi:MAG TPA: pitrilysin family protein [Candidatus Saccharimonadales bacterium]|nr:pitrilysin family protein [Candidatus Saccharimonadales bacterium]
MDLAAFGIKKHTFALKNGLRVVLFERANMPIHLRAAFKAGCKYDPPGKEGLAHFSEHLLLAGTKRFPSSTELGAFIEQYGGWYNANTPKEEINLDIAIGDPADTEVAFEMMGEMLTTSLFLPQSIVSERESVLGEVGEWEANPSKQIWEVQNRLYFQGTPLGRHGVGTTSGVKASKRDDLVSFVSETITSDRGVVVVAGGISKQDAENLSEIHFGNLHRSRADFSDGEAKVLRQKPILIVPKENRQIQLTLGFRTCPMAGADEAALDVISAVLGRGGSSSLQRVLRHDQALVYSVWAESVNLAAGGWISVETTAAKAKLQQILDAICLEFRRVYKGKLSQAEIDLAKAKIVKSTRLYLQSSYDVALSHSRYSLQVDSGWDVFDYDKRVSAVTADDIKRVGNKYFRPGEWYLGLIGDVKESDFSVNY